jgi:hypothetical protein
MNSSEILMQDPIAPKISFQRYWPTKKFSMPMHAKSLLVAIIGGALLSACTTAKLEARLEANPQCKDVINPKTGALMPCPGTDKSFYKSIGLESPKNSSTVLSEDAPVQPGNKSALLTSPVAPSSSSTAVIPQQDCKPQIHKKTGGILPCPANE